MPVSCHSPPAVSRVRIRAARSLDWLRPAYSVEKLPFSAEAIFQFLGNAAEKLRKTPRTADRERLRAEIVKSGCSLESMKFPAFHSATIFTPTTRREFFNRIGRDEPVSVVACDDRLQPAKPGHATCRCAFQKADIRTMFDEPCGKCSTEGKREQGGDRVLAGSTTF